LKEIKPYIVVLYVLGVLLLLSPVLVFAPENGWDLGFTKVKFLTIENYIHPKEQEEVDLSEIIIQVDTSMVVTDIDSLIKHQENSTGNLGAGDGGEVAVVAETGLILNEGAEENLGDFFQEISNLSNSRKKISILHYGDSQIEGDRISKYLRNRFQARFGGCGLGLVPIKARGRIRSTIFTDYSPNWKKYAYIDSKNKPFHNKLGILAAYYRFTPRLSDGDSVKEMQHAWVQYKDPHLSYRRASEIENMKILYRNPKEKLGIEAVIDGKVVAKEDLDISEDLAIFQTDIKTNVGLCIAPKHVAFL